MSFEYFAQIPPAPIDPIFGVNEMYKNDPREDKVNLTIGVYLNEEGRLPLFHAVQEAQRELIAENAPHGYLPMAGLQSYCDAIQRLVFGEQSEAVLSKRICTVQALGGTGALHLGVAFAKKYLGSVKGMASTPTWNNHLKIMSNVGLEAAQYPYYDAATKSVNFDGMVASLNEQKAGTVIILHACCHNPTGLDLTKDQWETIIETVKEKKLLPLLDIAYQGFGFGIDEDAYAPRRLAEESIPFMVASSCSKNFGLYGERVGALHIVAETSEEALLIKSALQQIIRSEFSNPPTFGVAVVERILNSPTLRKDWESELLSMRECIALMRSLLAEEGKKNGLDLDFIARQHGMFSFTDFTKEQMQTLRHDHGLYALDNSRICLTGINRRNIERIVSALKKI